MKVEGMETTAVFRSVDQHGGTIVSTVAEIDQLKSENARLTADYEQRLGENYRLASRIEVLEAELAAAQSASKWAWAAAAMARGTR